MANEFIIKNGFESKGDSEITGSLNVSGARFDVEAVLGETKYISSPTSFYKETYNPSGKVIFRTSDANSPTINQGNSQFGTGITELRQSDLLSGVVTNYSYCSITPSAALLIHRHSGSSAGADSGFVSNDAGLTIVDMHTSPKGLEYFADYSATYVSRSLVDKEYVDDYVAASASADTIYNADSTLTGDRIVGMGTSSITFSGSRFDVEAYLGERTYSAAAGGFSSLLNTREVITPSGPELYAGYSSYPAGASFNTTASFIAGNVELRASELDNGIITNYSYCRITGGAGLLFNKPSGSNSESGYVVNDSGLFVVDTLPSQNGLQYAADYSATYVSRSLVDKEYVVDYVAASSSADNISNVDLTQTDLNRVYTRSPIAGVSRLRLQGASHVLTLEDSTELQIFSGKYDDAGAVPRMELSGNQINFNGQASMIQGVNSEMFIYGQFNTTLQTKIQLGADLKLNSKSNRYTVFNADQLRWANSADNTGYGQILNGVFCWGGGSGNTATQIGNEGFSVQKDMLVKGSNNAVGTSGFKVTDVNNNSLLDIKNSGKIIISKAQTGVSLESYSNLSVWAGVSNSSVESIRVSAGTNYSGVHFIDNNSVVGSSTSGNIFLKGNFGSSSTESLVNLNDNIEFKTKSSKAVKFFTNNIQFINDTDSVTYGRIISDVFVWGGATGSFLSPIGTEKFSIQVDTLIKGSDTSASTTGFKVTNSANTSLLDIKNDGKTEITGKLDLSTTTDGFLMPRLTTAQMNAISSPDTDLLVFNTDLACVMRYNGTAWTTFDSPKYIVRSGGTNTPYSNFKTAVDDAPAGAVLEVHTSEVIDVGMPSTYWNWTKDLTIQTNGHDVILTNLSRIQIAAASNLNTLNIIGGGTFSSSHNQVFTIYRNLTINSDGATNIVSTSTGGVLFQPLSNVAGTTFIVNNVKSVGVYFSFTRNNNLQHYTTLNNCHIDLTNSTTNASIVNHLRITANNCTFKHTGGSITYPQNSAFPTVIEDEAFIFNNCTTVGNYGRCMLRLNNCSITTITTTNSGIYQVTLEANNTSFRNINTGSPSNLQGFAIMTSTELVILKNCTINSDWGGVYLSGVSSVIDNCIIKSGNSWGVFRYNSGANVSNFLTIKNSTIECGNYSAVGTIYGSLGKQFDISNTTIITSGASSYCLYMNTGTYARFDNLKLKNLATPANILSRADLLTENPQINTLDNLGNIVLA